MKILKRILATLVLLVMIPVAVVGTLALIVSTEIQPENLAEMTTDIVAETLDKENLRKIKVADFADFLPSDLKAKLPADADIEEAVPVVFNSISGLESYISLETVEQIIEDNTIKDVVMAIINNEERDFVGLFEKYNIPLEDWQREELAKVSVETIRNGLSDQGFDIDEMVSGGFITGGATQNSGSGQNGFGRILEFLNPSLVIPILVATLAVFYLLISLVLWDFREGLYWWGAGLILAGIGFLILSAAKFELMELGLGMAKMKINTAVLAPAMERIARPIILAGVTEVSIGIGAIVGGIFWNKRGRQKDD